MPDTLLAALVGAGGALIGSVVGAITTFLVQKRLIAAQASREIRRDSLSRQLVALQELNLAIDFAYGNVGTTAGGPVGELFVAIVRDSPRHLAFLPADLRVDARSLLFEYFKGAKNGAITIDDAATKSLQARVLGHIDRVFTEYSNERR
jgi:hypothetical protein